MKILSMTATFGKLQNKRLELKPGLNVIHAPNEWGKSTWCAFLIAMLYGIDTRERTTATTLADKEHYSPWSGGSMAGSMDIEWNGRRITIQRQSRGRGIFNDFSARETDSGLSVPELTADNCGQQLLGVERSVFTRSAFLRFSEMSIGQDEALRSRLNALVTTGDESNTAQVLAQKLKTLKNKCDGRAGILPQVQAQRSKLAEDLDKHSVNAAQAAKLRQRQAELEQWTAQLENHKAALEYQASRTNAQRIAQAEAQRDAAQNALTEIKQQCQALPSREEAQARLEAVTTLRLEWDSLQMEQQMLPPAPTVPPTPSAFYGMTPEDALEQAKKDAQTAQAARTPSKVPGILLLILGIIALAAGVAVALAVHTLLGIGIGAAGALLSVIGLVLNLKRASALKQIRSQLDALSQRYGNADPNAWIEAAAAFLQSWTDYRQAQAEYTALRGDVDIRTESLTARIAQAGGNLAQQEKQLLHMLDQWDALFDARRNYQQLSAHVTDLRSMIKPVAAPTMPDDLTHSMEDTLRLLSDAAQARRQLDQQLGQFHGQADALGDREQLEKQLRDTDARITRLEQTSAALELAQNTLTAAAGELQRRFAPRITQHARTLFGRLTDGRYARLTLNEDLTMRVGTTEEVGEERIHYRSDGTVDQLYLALRLAVARELTPQAPLVLDDALIRFDDTRLKTALEILSDEAKDRQVILFSCHNREKQLLDVLHDQ